MLALLLTCRRCSAWGRQPRPLWSTLAAALRMLMMLAMLTEDADDDAGDDVAAAASFHCLQGW